MGRQGMENQSIMGRLASSVTSVDGIEVLGMKSMGRLDLSVTLG